METFFSYLIRVSLWVFTYLFIYFAAVLKVANLCLLMCTKLGTCIRELIQRLRHALLGITLTFPQ